MISIRQLQQGDNAVLATIIRNALKEFGADRPGTVFYDTTTDDLFSLFQKPGSAYFVAVEGARTLGGAGIYPSDGLPAATAELVKMYLDPDARGKGTGRLLMQSCMDFARQNGYRHVYLETLSELWRAVEVYEQFGFVRLPEPLGNTGHFGCTMWMIRKL